MVLNKAIEVKVLVKGVPAQEYNDDEEESQGPKTVTKYIEAKSGAEFAVQIELTPPFWFPSEALEFDLSIDGKRLENVLLVKEQFIEHPRGQITILEGISRSHGVTWSLEKFKFTEVTTSQLVSQFLEQHC